MAYEDILRPFISEDVPEEDDGEETETPEELEGETVSDDDEEEEV